LARRGILFGARIAAAGLVVFLLGTWRGARELFGLNGEKWGFFRFAY